MSEAGVYEGAGARGRGGAGQTRTLISSQPLRLCARPRFSARSPTRLSLNDHVHRHPLRLQWRHRGRRAAALRGADRHAGRIRLPAGPRHLLSRLPRVRRPRVLPLHLRAGRRGRGGGRLQEAIERKNAHYARAIRSSMQLVPGAAEFVAEAALDGHQLGVVSGALRREIELVLSLAGASTALRRDRRRGGRGRVQARPAGLPRGARASWRWSRGGASWWRTRSRGSPPRARPGFAAPCSPPRIRPTPLPRPTWSGPISPAAARANSPGPMSDAGPDARPRAARALRRGAVLVETRPAVFRVRGAARSPACRDC